MDGQTRCWTGGWVRGSRDNSGDKAPLDSPDSSALTAVRCSPRRSCSVTTCVFMRQSGDTFVWKCTGVEPSAQGALHRPQRLGTRSAAGVCPAMCACAGLASSSFTPAPTPGPHTHLGMLGFQLPHTCTHTCPSRTCTRLTSSLLALRCAKSAILPTILRPPRLHSNARAHTCSPMHTHAHLRALGLQLLCAQHRQALLHRHKDLCLAKVLGQHAARLREHVERLLNRGLADALVR
eukprot:363560-Chlamydomonas_euryale.AAC.5